MSYTQEEKEFFKYLRNIYFSSKYFRQKIIKSFEKNHGKIDKKRILNDTSFIIAEFIKYGKIISSDIYNKVESDWVALTISEWSQNIKKFPTITKKLSDLYAEINNKMTIQEVHQLINSKTSNLFSKICFSNKQFNKHLAGETFEFHIKIILNILKYKFNYQKSIRKGEVLDFIYPDLKKLNTNPNDCMVSECQSTLKDRFRQTLGKIEVVNPVKRFLFTASGSGLITDSDVNDLAKYKVKEINEKGWILVVFKQVKNKKFKSNKQVISYEDFFNRIYPANSKLW